MKRMMRRPQLPLHSHMRQFRRRAMRAPSNEMPRLPVYSDETLKMIFMHFCWGRF